MTCWHTAPSSRRFSTIWGLARPPEVFLRKNMARNRGGDSFVAYTKSAGAPVSSPVRPRAERNRGVFFASAIPAACR